MPSYPIAVRPCQHMKANDIQCGSPAMRHELFCYFHLPSRLESIYLNAFRKPSRFPSLADQVSIRLGLGEVWRLLVTHQIDYRTAVLMRYALQTAALNLKSGSPPPTPMASE